MSSSQRSPTCAGLFDRDKGKPEHLWILDRCTTGSITPSDVKTSLSCARSLRVSLSRSLLYDGRGTEGDSSVGTGQPEDANIEDTLFR